MSDMSVEALLRVSEREGEKERQEKEDLKCAYSTEATTINTRRNRGASQLLL